MGVAAAVLHVVASKPMGEEPSKSAQALYDTWFPKEKSEGHFGYNWHKEGEEPSKSAGHFGYNWHKEGEEPSKSAQALYDTWFPKEKSAGQKEGEEPSKSAGCYHCGR